jgi:hypothetical protein
MRVSKSTLSGPLPWYHTRAGTFDVTESVPATLCYGGNGTDNIHVWFSGVIEFKDPIPTSSTPVVMALRAKVREEKDGADAQRMRQYFTKLFGGVPLFTGVHL